MLGRGCSVILFVLASPGRVSPSPSQESLCSSKSDDPGVSQLNYTFVFPENLIGVLYFCVFYSLETPCFPNRSHSHPRQVVFQKTQRRKIEMPLFVKSHSASIKVIRLICWTYPGQR